MKTDDAGNLQPLRIAFAISGLQAGGAERIATTLSNAWAAGGHEVHIVTLEPPDARSQYLLQSAIRVHPLDALNRSTSLSGTLLRTASRVRRIRATLRIIRPDVIVAFISEMNTLALLATRFLSVPVVVSERSHPELNRMGWLRRQARDKTYPLATRLVVQSTSVRDWYRDRLGIHSVVIANPLDLAVFSPPALSRTFAVDTGTIVSVGRLDQWKGHHTLIDAFARLAPSHPGWRLEIYGRGPLRKELKERLEGHGLKGRARLMGVTDRVADVLRAADIFAFASRYEGYPNAIIEALGCGCPVVATDCPGASAEILGHGKHGVLVPVEDVIAMAGELDALIRDPERRRVFSSNGPAAIAHLDTSVIAERWVEVFGDVLKRKASARK